MTDRSGMLAPRGPAREPAELVDDNALLTAMLDTEVALAEAQAELGVIPEAAAKAIRAAAVADHRPRGRGRGSARDGEPRGRVRRRQLTAAVRSRAAAEYVHRGSTSQDILDTAADAAVRGDPGPRRPRICWPAPRAWPDTSGRHRDTPMAGRTLTQHAVPVTFGLKAATWLHARARRRRAGAPGAARACRSRSAARPGRSPRTGVRPDRVRRRSTLRLTASVAEAARARRAGPALARNPHADRRRRIGAAGHHRRARQDRPPTSWCCPAPRSARSPRSSAPGRGASSAMPQKHNPVFATLVATAARQLPPIAVVLFGPWPWRTSGPRAAGTRSGSRCGNACASRPAPPPMPPPRRRRCGSHPKRWRRTCG